MKRIIHLLSLTNNKVVVTARNIFGEKDISRILKLTNNKQAKNLAIIYLIAALVSFFAGIFFKEQILSLPAYWLIFLCIFILICSFLWKTCMFSLVVHYQGSKHYTMNTSALLHVLAIIALLAELHRQHMAEYAKAYSAYLANPYQTKTPNQLAQEYQEKWDKILQKFKEEYGLFDKDIEDFRLGQTQFLLDEDENEDENEDED